MNANGSFLTSVLCSVANIRAHLAAAVPPADQILLLGPPYKVPRDAVLRSTETLRCLQRADLEDEESITVTDDQQQPIFASLEQSSSAKRFFLFSKQSFLTDAAPGSITPCRLEPTDIELPMDIPSDAASALPFISGSSSSLLSSAPPPLHQALAAYERQFMLYLTQGRVLADGADLRHASCLSCLREQLVIMRAIRAAVANLTDHYDAATRTRQAFTADFGQRTTAHATLLQDFETSLLPRLASLTLHPALQQRAQARGRPDLTTLLATVPVDRERAWAAQCRTSHQRLLALYSELEGAFNAMSSPAGSSRDQERDDLLAESQLQQLWRQVQGAGGRQIRNAQASRLDQLTRHHQEVVRIIMNAVNDDDAVQAAFTPLRQMSDACKDIIPAMRNDDEALRQLMETVAQHKTAAMTRIRERLRAVSSAQSTIQGVLSSVGVLKEALAQQCENMMHLEHVAELPASYTAFLSELRRRRAYSGAVAATTTAVMERLAVMREDEVKAREAFLRGPGRHLMPAFFEIFAPGLATPPPLFTPQLPILVELDTLPDVEVVESSEILAQEDEEPANVAAVSASLPAGDAVMHDGTTSASTLTTDSMMRALHSFTGVQPMTVSTAEGAAGGVVPPAPLIVSADERSTGDGDDLIAGGSSSRTDLDTKEIEAKVKTLEYENSVLRQALEQQGSKPPRTYIEKAPGGDETTVAPQAPATSELEDVRNQLVVALADLRKAKKALKKSSHGDKISHSSFALGDVGLFMPTGMGLGGKQTYLAFHSNCPHRYLSTDNIDGTPDFVLGRIVSQDEKTAVGDLGSETNPYSLAAGTLFWVLTVEVIKAQYASM
jgi:Autophagy protein ATG17-like domain/Autophagy-related protein 11